MIKPRIGYSLVVIAILAGFILARRNHLAVSTEPGTVVIRVAHFTIDPNFRSFMDRAALEYNKLHPNVRIKQMDIPRQVYMQWQRTQIVGNMAPEIMQFAYFNTGVEDMVKHNFVVLDPWVEKPNPYWADNRDARMWRDTFIDGLGSRDAYSQKLRAYFGIPLIMGGYRFFYNADMLETTGAPVPSWTFAQFRDIAATLKENGLKDTGGNPVSAIVGSEYSAYSTFRTMFSSVTQPLQFTLDRDYDLLVTSRDTAMGLLDGRWNYQTPEVQAGLKLMRETAGLLSAGFTQLQKPDGILQFAQGRALALSGGLSDLSYLRQVAPFPVAEASFPTPDQNDPVYGQHVLGPVTELRGSSTLTLGVTRSPLQEQAVDFLQFLTGPKMMAILHEETGWRTAVADPASQAGSTLKPGYPDTLYDDMNTRGNIMSFRRNYHLLFKHEGGIEAFAERLDRESPAEMRSWLEAEANILRQTLRQQEAAIIANWALARTDDGSQQYDQDALDDFLALNNEQETDYRALRVFLTP